ncbi:hypothetical protein J2045_003916 [Peteryoungia aggregata LMG 23059]|uniref:Ribulose-1,5-bisphosphate carboxylase/oxygenase large subunit n=1 Tax=Peteryoungia aggregata LMG 23059 TaxID=1368425 RepID=A0ABU0GBY6_9HYPH|nr:hypothetical protein [Peteryoungia aggregata LMG 23059]
MIEDCEKSGKTPNLAVMVRFTAFKPGIKLS